MFIAYTECSSSGDTWAVVVAALVGGIIGLVTIPIAWWLQRKSRHQELLIEAYVAWSGSFEATVSHLENLCRLVGLKSSIESQGGTALDTYRKEVIDVSKKHGDAGRKLDADSYRLLMLEKKSAAREGVMKITQATKASDLRIADQIDGQGAQAVLKRTGEWRQELNDLLKSLADKGHFIP